MAGAAEFDSLMGNIDAVSYESALAAEIPFKPRYRTARIPGSRLNIEDHLCHIHDLGGREKQSQEA